MKNKKGMIYGVLLMTCLVIGLSYGAFIFSTDKYRSSELLISKLNYSIDIQEDGSSKSTINGSSVTVPASTKVYLNITLTSVNEIDSKYTLAYKTSTNAKVEYSDRTPWNTQGIIKGIDSNTYSKKIRVVIDNTDISTSSTVNFQVYGGYSFNSYANIELTDGYVSVSGPYTEVATNIGNRLVDIIESDTSCLTSTSNTCLYGGENIKNYVQYPENEDKTKNLWRIIGSYQIDDQTLPKLISQSTTSTSTSTLTTDLTSFYNTLEDKEVLVQQTNKFNCFTSTCAESTYNNIGLLTDYEYNQIGGVNSYLTSNENYYINSSSGIKEVTSSGITNSSSTSGLKPTIYLQTGVQVTGSGTVSDPYIISPASDINLVAYTLNGQATDKTYADLLKTNVVKNVICKNGTTATWDNTDFSIKLKNIHTPDYCTIDFGDGYSVSLTATNGTITAPTTVTTGYNGTATFTVTPNDGYKSELESHTCGGTLSGNTYTISNITSGKSCSITFKSSTPTLAEKVLEDNPTISERTDFSVSFTTNTANTLYKAQEDNIDVYYFAGMEDNSEPGSCVYDNRIIYKSDANQYYSNRISEEACSKQLELCVKTDRAIIYKLSENDNDTENCYYLYSGTYVKVDKGTWISAKDNTHATINNWVKFGKNASNQDLYWRIIRTNSDGGVRLLYHGTSTTATDAYIGESRFNSSSKDIAYASYMYGSLGSIPNARENTNNSTIKTTIDNWYTRNLEAKGYTKYLSTTAVYCNDRTYTVSGRNTYFGARTRLETNKTPSYDCAAKEDKFTVDTSTGNGKLTYPIALMTADEVSYAGGVYSSYNANAWYFRNAKEGGFSENTTHVESSYSSTGMTSWYLMSPYRYFYGDNADVFNVSGSLSPGYLRSTEVGSAADGVRPVVSLKSCVRWKSGDGTANAPYTIEETTSGC